MVTFISPPNSPEFHRNLVLELNRVFSRYGQVEHYQSTALPPAANSFMMNVYLDDLNTYAVSDGTDWRPYTLGAPL